MAKLSGLNTFLLTFLLFLPHLVSAYSETPEVKYYEQDDITNQIPYFDHRFHIDAQLEEVTLLFYRKSGTPPIILVRPDGSKLKINNLPKDKVEWFDDKTFDMIKIIKPMPGPWQAVGSISPNSKIMVVSDVTLKVEPLSEIVLSGETLKIEAKIFNGNTVVEDPLFNDVINLDIDFFSTNNTAFDNFGAEPVKIGSFRDDGYELDEYARDGIFTAEFVLDFSPGEWVPLYRVIMPMITREVRQNPIILRQNPVTISVEATVEPLEFHQVIIAIDETYVDPDSLIFQGNITFPDRQTEPFAIMEGSGNSRIHKVGYTEAGIHRINLNAYGKTVNGREFRLVVPEFTFNVEVNSEPFSPAIANEGTFEINNTTVAAKQLAAQIEHDKAQNELALEEAIAVQKAEAEAKQQQTLFIIGISNAVIILVAVIVFLVLRRKKK